MKICNKCDEEKPQSDFHKAKTTPDGRCYTCKDCKNAETKVRYERANDRNYKLKGDDFAILDMHKDYQVTKAYVGTGHGVVASDHADWRTKANKRRLVVTVTQRRV